MVLSKYIWCCQRTYGVALREMLNESTELEVAILDTLGNLCLEASDLAELRGDVVRTLPSAQLCDVPVIVKLER